MSTVIKKTAVVPGPAGDVTNSSKATSKEKKLTPNGGSKLKPEIQKKSTEMESEGEDSEEEDVKRKPE